MVMEQGLDLVDWGPLPNIRHYQAHPGPHILNNISHQSHKESKTIDGQCQKGYCFHILV